MRKIMSMAVILGNLNTIIDFIVDLFGFLILVKLRLTAIYNYRLIMFERTYFTASSQKTKLLYITT